MTIVEKISSRIPQPLRRSIPPVSRNAQGQPAAPFAIPHRGIAHSLARLRSRARKGPARTMAAPPRKGALDYPEHFFDVTRKATVAWRQTSLASRGIKRDRRSLMSGADSLSSELFNSRLAVSTSRVFSHPPVTEVEALSVFLSSDRPRPRSVPGGQGEFVCREVASSFYGRKW